MHYCAECGNILNTAPEVMRDAMKCVNCGMFWSATQHALSEIITIVGWKSERPTD